MSIVCKLIVALHLLTIIISAEQNNSGKYWVYYEKPVLYSEALRCYSANNNKKSSSIPAYDLIKEFNPKVISLENISGDKLPRFSFCRFEIEIADSLEAHSTMGKFENSSIVYDEMGYQQYEWSVRTEKVINSSIADSICNGLKSTLKSSFVCLKNEETAIIVFGMNLTKGEADELVGKIRKKNIPVTSAILDYIEVDL